MKFVNSILYIEFQELVSAGVSENTLKRANVRESNSWTFIDDPDDKRKVLIEYEAMKPQYKELVDSKLCGGMSPYMFMATRIIDRQLISKIDDIDYFDTQQLEDKTRLRAVKACQYLYLLERCRYSSQKKEIFPMWSTDEFWSYLVTHIKSNPTFRQKNGVNLPTAKPRLNHLAKLYLQHGPTIVINKRKGNKNSSKLGRAIIPGTSNLTEFSQDLFNTQTAVLWGLRSHINNLDFVQITDNYNDVAQTSGWPRLTSMRVYEILSDGRADLITTPGRKGKETFRNKFSIQEKRTPPTQPLYFVSIDGWDVELAYQARVQNKAGKWITRSDNRLVVVIILDPFCKYPVGYAIDNSESIDLIKKALKNALDHVYEMTGEYAAPYQTQSDHYGLATLTPFYESIAHLHISARLKNAKAKPIEPYFKYLNKKYCQGELWPNWTGFGITSRKENQPNLEIKNNIKNHFPDREGVIRQIEYIIAKERELKSLEYFAALKKAPKRIMTKTDYLRAIGTVNQKTIQAHASGLILTHNNIKYTYDSDDITFRTHFDKNWKVIYDPTDMSSILVENKDGAIIYLLKEKYNQPMAILDQKEGDKLKLEATKKSNKALEEAVSAANNENYFLLEQHLSSDERLNSFRQKLMFTQNGQQKDPLQESKGKVLTAHSNNVNIKSTKDQLRKIRQQEAEEAEREFWARQERIIDEKFDSSKF